MADLVWAESLYGTGDATVDAQHQELFKRINDLTRSFQNGAGHSEVNRLIEFLGGYVVQHFRCEEDIMDRKKCSACKTNKAAHAEFINHFGVLKEQFERDGVTEQFGKTLTLTIHGWIRAHIMGVDTQLKEVAR